MTIAKVLAVYKTTPIVLVVESEDSPRHNILHSGAE
jgi:hypothetical protein